MKNLQKPLLSRGAIGSIFALVMVATLSGYGLEPVKTNALGSGKAQSSATLTWNWPNFNLASLSNSDTDEKPASEKKESARKTVTISKKVGSAKLVSYTTLSDDQPVVGPVIPELTDEEKVAKIEAYFGKYNLPLADHAEKLVEVSHYCDIDWRLLSAIGMQESTGGKFMRNNNPFGWGSARIGFADMDEAIEVVGGHLCGLYDKTDAYYKDKTTAQKLWYYNGSVNPRYPGEVMAIMNKIQNTPIENQ